MLHIRNIIKFRLAKKYNEISSCHMQDRYADAQSLPPIDPQQDWNLIRGENKNGFTTLEFWRKWVTCDERDRDIEVSKD